MSANTGLVSIDESIALPFPISCAFDRSLGVLASADAFVDRVFYLGELVDSVRSWRWANVITAEQESFLYRKVRRTVEGDLGAITSEESCSAVEIHEREKQHAEWDAQEQAQRQVS